MEKDMMRTKASLPELGKILDSRILKLKIELRLERWDWGKVMKGVPSDLNNQMPQLTREAAVASHASLETAGS